MPITIGCDRLPGHELHGEERPATLCHPRVMDPHDVGVMHQRQGLLLDVESRQELARGQTRSEELQCDRLPERFYLLRVVHHPHATTSQEPLDSIAADAVPSLELDGICGGPFLKNGQVYGRLGDRPAMLRV